MDIIKTRLKQYLSSWTVNYGLLLAIMGVVQSYVETLRDPMLTMIAGAIVVALRFKTKEPLHEK